MKIVAPILVVYTHCCLLVLFLPRVHCVLGNILLKLVLVEAYGNKVQQVCLVVVGLGSPF